MKSVFLSLSSLFVIVIVALLAGLTNKAIAAEVRMQCMNGLRYFVLDSKKGGLSDLKIANSNGIQEESGRYTNGVSQNLVVAILYDKSGRNTTALMGIQRKFCKEQISDNGVTFKHHFDCFKPGGGKDACLICKHDFIINATFKYDRSNKLASWTGYGSSDSGQRYDIWTGGKCISPAD